MVTPASASPSENASSFAKLSSADSGEADFVRNFTQSQRALYLYIIPLVSCAADAEEVLQETNVVIWTKRSEYQPGTNFLAWGRAIARFEVFRFRRRSSHKDQLLGDDVINLLASEVDEQTLNVDLRRDALSNCVGKLRPKDRELIEKRYTPGNTGDDVANELGRPANSVYQSIGRIRRTLLECVKRQLSVTEAG
ncbi:MAG: sigma-70 family RNA polymerase sigma factor [Planctomycetaceae bacterium]|nr:sigma-70 family RNA polymerase sigma factor [Planctomycetaceae bacterium]